MAMFSSAFDESLVVFRHVHVCMLCHVGSAPVVYCDVVCL